MSAPFSEGSMWAAYCVPYAWVNLVEILVRQKRTFAYRWRATGKKKIFHPLPLAETNVMENMQNSGYLIAAAIYQAERNRP